MKSFLARQWFLLSLLVVLCVGFVGYQPLGPLAEAPRVRNLIVMVTLFVVTLPVPTATLVQAIRFPWPALLASLISMAVMPVVAMLMAQLVQGDLGTGVVVMAATPGTVASAAVWTRRADGNEMVPILVTVITSLTCFLITPIWLYVWTGQQTAASSSISFGGMSIKLVMFVVLPMVAGQWSRAISSVGMWADHHRPLLSNISQCGILSIVLVGAVQCGRHLRSNDVGASFLASDFGWLCLILATIYVAVFWGGLRLSRMLGVNLDDAIGVGFAGSQKTLMVGLQVAILMGGGLIILPMVTYHVLQLVIGAVFADKIRAYKQRIAPASLAGPARSG